MKIINGQDVVMGRLASFVAKELLKGEEINVVNCNKVIISGNKKILKKNLKKKDLNMVQVKKVQNIQELVKK